MADTDEPHELDDDALDAWLDSGRAPFGADDPSVAARHVARRDHAPLDDDALDEEFPLGDGVADVDGIVVCPYCGETNEIALDPGSGETQEYVEDCQVCCQPWHVLVRYGADGTASIRIEPDAA
jgi:Cysteine-rich CPXCG